MPITTDPLVADNVAAFGAGKTPAASISYDVPLPGAYSFDRLVPLELSNAVFPGEVGGTGVSMTEMLSAGGNAQENIIAIYREMVGGTLEAAETPEQPRVPAPPGVPGVPGVPGGPSGPGAGLPDAVRAILVKQLNRSRPSGELKRILLPAPGVGRTYRAVEFDSEASDTPRIALMETCQLSSFLGDYGLGKTVRTFSLLPGERTTITLQTWRTSEVMREQGSSIFDSADEAAETRFTDAVERQSGSAFQDQGGWAFSAGVNASVSGSIGIVSGSAEVNVGFSANHQEARQQFSKSVSQASRDHAAQVNTSRQQSVQSSESSRSEEGESQVISRELANTNLRRVLNFVFRELNQKWTAVTSLRDVHVVFYNGNADSADIVPLAELRRFLERYVVEAERERVARAILRMACACVDHEGTPQTMLELGSREGGVFDWQDATLGDDGEIKFDGSVLDRRICWRIKSGPVGQADDQGFARVDGVATRVDEIVLRTDTVVAEALLGQADALDPYATALQVVDLEARGADVEWRESETERVRTALAIIDEQAGAARVDAYVRLLGDKPDVTVVPAVGVASDDDGSG